MRAHHGAGFALALLVATALHPSAAHADDMHAERRVVVLRDGSVFQGELVESVPGDHTTLKLATGEVRRFDARDMMPPTPRPTLPFPSLLPVFPGSTPTPNEYGGADGVRVHIETNKPYATYLYRAAKGGPAIGWDRLCLAPCDIPVDPSRTYRIGGERIVDSAPFQLAPRASETLYVDATSAGVPTMGVLFLALGAALTAPGVYCLTRPESPDDGPGPSGSSIVGWVLIANGIPWLITGIALLAAGGTTVKADDGRSVATRSDETRPPFGNLGPLTSGGWVF
jgi:hypothetical protein